MLNNITHNKMNRISTSSIYEKTENGAAAELLGT